MSADHGWFRTDLPVARALAGVGGTPCVVCGRPFDAPLLARGYQLMPDTCSAICSRTLREREEAHDAS